MVWLRSPLHRVFWNVESKDLKISISPPKNRKVDLHSTNGVLDTVSLSIWQPVSICLSIYLYKFGQLSFTISKLVDESQGK